MDEDLLKLIDLKFQLVQKEINHINEKFATMKWVFGILTPSITAILVALITEVMK